MRMTIAFLLLLLTVTDSVAQPMPAAPKGGVPDSEVEALITKSLDPNTKTASEAVTALVELGPNAVPALTQGLWSDSTATRRACAMALGEIGADARSAIPSLVRVLNDDSKDVRRTAARALGAVHAHSAIPALTRALKDESPAIRLAAAESLIALGAAAETVIPVLTKSLKSEQLEEQQYAVVLLGDLGPEAAPALLAIQGALVEADPALTVRIAETLGRIGPEAKTAAPVLKKKVQDDPNAALFRVPAAIALWRIHRDGDAAEFLRAALAAKKMFRPLPHVPLWRIDRSQETVDALLARLKSENEFDRFAADVLGNRAKESVPLLIKILKKFTEPGENAPELDARIGLWIGLLGGIGPDAKEALEPLTAIAKMKNALSFPAAVAVYQIDPKLDNALAIAAYLEDKDYRLQAAEALKRLRPTGKAVAIELLVALESTDEALRLAAAIALWRIEKNPAALKTMTKLLRSADARMREQTALELGNEFGADAKAATPDLAKRLFDSRAGVRSVAAEALGRVGPGARDAAPALLALLEGDESAFVQSAACEALGRIEPADKDAVAAALKQKLEHPAPIVRVHAALALVLAANDKSGQDEAVRGLTHRTHYVRITAAEALWRINKDGRAVALLIRALEESNLSGLENDNERYMAARALGRIGADAKPAVPELLKLIDARDDVLAATARTALKLIDPDAARNAGVK